MRVGNCAVYASQRVVTDFTQCYFYHTIDLPGIGTVEGTWDLRAGLTAYSEISLSRGNACWM